MKEGPTKRECIAAVAQLGGMGGVAAEVITHQDIKIIVPTALIAIGGFLAGIKVSREEVKIPQATITETDPQIDTLRKTYPSTTTVFQKPIVPIDAEFTVLPPNQS